MANYLRTARATYAWAHGLHTTHHYPQQFHVRLTGEPAVLQNGSRVPCIVAGHSGARAAISAVFDTISDINAHPRSLCNHPACIYNMGDLITRRKRHELAIAHINQQLSGRASPPSSSGSTTEDETVLIFSTASTHRTVLDSGASRHIESRRALFDNLYSCSPVHIQGIRATLYQ